MYVSFERDVGLRGLLVDVVQQDLKVTKNGDNIRVIAPLTSNVEIQHPIQPYSPFSLLPLSSQKILHLSLKLLILILPLFSHLLFLSQLPLESLNLLLRSLLLTCPLVKKLSPALLCNSHKEFFRLLGRLCCFAGVQS